MPIRSGEVTAVVVSGAATGVVLEQTGTVDVVAENEIQAGLDAVPYAPCPGVDVVGDVHRGDRVYLTGRTADGAWLEMRAPFDITGRVWVEAAWVTADESVDGLPVVECSGAMFGQPALVEATTPATASSTDAAPTSSSSSSTTTDPGATTSAPTTVADTTGPTIDLRRRRLHRRTWPGAVPRDRLGHPDPPEPTRGADRLLPGGFGGGRLSVRSRLHPFHDLGSVPRGWGRLHGVRRVAEGRWERALAGRDAHHLALPVHTRDLSIPIRSRGRSRRSFVSRTPIRPCPATSSKGLRRAAFAGRPLATAGPRPAD